MGCGARRRAGRGRGQSGGGPGARGARRHGGRRGARPPLTRRSVPVVGEPEPPGALRRGDEQVRGALLLPAGLQRLEGGDQDAAGARRRSPRSVRGGGAREARGPAAGGLLCRPRACRSGGGGRGGSRAALCRRAAGAPAAASAAGPAAPAPRSRGGGTAGGTPRRPGQRLLRGPRPRPEGVRVAPAVAASGGSSACLPSSFPLCRDTGTRLHLLLRPGERGCPGVAAARSTLGAWVLEARVRGLNSALLLWRLRGSPPPLGCPRRPGTRGPWPLPATSLPQFGKVSGSSPPPCPTSFPGLKGFAQRPRNHPQKGRQN